MRTMDERIVKNIADTDPEETETISKILKIRRRN
jgi:hypothetical protein